MSIAPPSIIDSLSDPELVKYAAQQKALGNMANFSLAFQTSQDRARMRQQAAAQAMGAPKTDVADSALQTMAADASQVPNTPTGIAQVGAGSAGQAPEVENAARGSMLPENQGIGTLPAKNLEKFADGGITGQRYADKGAVESSNPDYQQMIIANAIANHVDPKVALAIAGAEGRIKNPKSSATGFYQITDDSWKGYGGNPDKRNDPAEQIRVGTRMLADNTQQLTKTLGRAPTPSEVYATHFLGGPTGTALLQADPNKKMSDFLKEVTPSKADKIISSNPEVLGKNGEKTVGDVRDWSQKTIAKKLTDLVPIGSAQAGTVPNNTPVTPTTPSQGGVASLIPGQSVQAPASTADQTTSYFGGVADRLGIPEEFQRNFSNTLNALGGWSSPVSSVGRGIGIASKALEPTAEMLTKAEQAKNAVSLPRIGYAAKVEGLTPEAQAMRDAAIANRQANILKADQQAATGAQQSVDAATQTSDIARKMEQDIAGARQTGVPVKVPGLANDVNLGGRLNEAKMSGAAQGLSLSNLSGGADQDAATTTTYSPFPADDGFSSPDFSSLQPSADKEKKADTSTQDTSGKGGRDWNDFLLNLGLGLMAGKSPYALQNLGEAGIGALRQEQEAKKQALQERQASSLEALQKQQGAYATAQAGYLESLKGPQAALELAEKRYDAWSKSPAGMQMTINDPAKANQMYKEFVQGSYKDLGIIHPSMMSPETAGFMSKYGVQ